LIRILRHLTAFKGILAHDANGYGGMGMRGGGQSESCIVNSHFQIYDVRHEKKY
jgi:hypothetical protein